MMKRFYFNMIEIILAISIIAIGISSVMVLFTSGLKTGNEAVQLNNLPDATESILAHIRQIAAANGTTAGWGTAMGFQNLANNGWNDESGVAMSAFTVSDTDERAIIPSNSGSNYLYRQLVVTAVNAAGEPTGYASTFSAIAEVRRINNPTPIMLSHPHKPLKEPLPADTVSAFTDADGGNSQTACRLVLEVRISYPAEAVPESRQSKIHRLEIFNDKYNRFVL